MTFDGDLEAGGTGGNSSNLNGSAKNGNNGATNGLRPNKIPLNPFMSNGGTNGLNKPSGDSNRSGGTNGLNKPSGDSNRSGGTNGLSKPSSDSNRSGGTGGLGNPSVNDSTRNGITNGLGKPPITNNGSGVPFPRKETDKLPVPIPTPPRGRTTDSLGMPNLQPRLNGNDSGIRSNTGQQVLNGALTAFSPSSVLSLLNIQKQTGTLYLTNNNITGYIYVEKGEVWDAKLGSVIGAYALFQLFGWKEGQFSFEVNAMDTPKRTIEASLPVLQVRATLWLDSWNKYNQLVPSVSHRIMLASDPPGGVVIEPHQWAVLTKIVARPLSVAELAEELDEDLMTVTRIAADLVRVGVAIVRPPESLDGRS